MEYCVVVDERLEDFDPEGKSFQRLGNSQTAKISFGGKSIVLTSGLAWWSYKCDVPWTGFPGSCGIWTCNHPNEHTPDHIYVRMADMDEIPVTKVLLASYSKIGAYCVALCNNEPTVAAAQGTTEADLERLPPQLGVGTISEGCQGKRQQSVLVSNSAGQRYLDC
jgi:hypothetical protein